MNIISLTDLDPNPDQALHINGSHSRFIPITFSYDGKWLAFRKDTRVQFLNLLEFTKINILNGHAKPVRSIAFSPDNRWLVSASDDKKIILWSLNNFKFHQILIGHSSDVNSVAVSHDNKWLASAADDKKVLVWDLNNLNQIHTLTAHQDAVNSVAFSYNNKWLASSSYDDNIILWDCLNDFKKHQIQIERNSYISKIMFSPSNEHLFFASNNKILILNLTNYNTTVEYNDSIDSVCSMALSSNNEWLASGSSEGKLIIWSLNNNNRDLLSGHSNSKIHSVTFNQNNEWLASASKKEIIFWNKLDNHWLEKFKVTINDLEFIPSSLIYPTTCHDKIIIAIGGIDHSVRLFEQFENKLMLLWNTKQIKLNPSQANITSSEISRSNKKLLIQRKAIDCTP